MANEIVRLVNTIKVMIFYNLKPTLLYSFDLMNALKRSGVNKLVYSKFGMYFLTS